MKERNHEVPQAEVPRAKVLLEAPLAKPISVDTFTPFDQCTICFAVDVSGSTEGVVLEEEKAAIEIVAEDLPTTTKQRCSIIPWDDDVDRYQASGLEDLQQLTSYGGTDPVVLLENQVHRNILQESKVWFLLTDGEMDLHAVNEFTGAIETHGLHSKACVLVIYGYRPSIPIHCNISVGVSVFGISPDCIFLFHDIETHELLLLQAKGCFNILIPDGKPLILTSGTTWNDLPVLTYGSLFKVQIPPSQTVRKNEFILQNRKVVNLEDLANNRLGVEDTNTILSDGQTLSSILVTMAARGKADEVKNWIGNQQISAGCEREFPRTDIGGNASKAITRIIDQWGKLQPRALSGLQEQLRNAHDQNWLALLDLVTEADKEAELRNTTLASATYRLARMDNEDNLHSPSCISPVLGDDVPAYHRSSSPARQTMHTDPVHPSSSARSPLKSWRNKLASKQKTDPSAIKAACRALQARMSYLPGFPSGAIIGSYPVECQLCAVPTRSMAIIFKEPPKAGETPGFPPSQCRSEILFPLAIAGYRETDIVSACACCDSCAYHLTRLARSPTDEHVTSAVPGMVDFQSREDKQAWLDAFDLALDARFERRNLLAIALSILTKALRQQSGDKSASGMALAQSLATTCRGLADECRISYASGRLGTLHDAMSFYLRQSHLDFQNELFDHPMESFTLLLRYVPAKTPRLYTSAFFMRLVQHLLEEFIESKLAYYAQSWFEFLDNLTPTAGFEQQMAASSLQSPMADCLANLIKRGFLDAETVDYCESLGDIWTIVEKECQPALLLCLRRLSAERLTCVDARETLQQWRRSETFKTIFEEPWKVAGEAVIAGTHQHKDMGWVADTGRGLVIAS